MQPAGFWIRLGAALIDTIILFVGGFIIGFVLGIFIALAGMQSAFNPVIPQVIGLLVGAAYITLCLASPWQATLGKRMVGVYVVDAKTGGRLSFAQAFARFIVASGICILLNLASASAEHAHNTSFTPEERAAYTELRKKDASTLTQPERELVDAIEQPPANYFVLTLAVLTLVYSLATAICLIATREKKAIHDMLCNTRAVRGRTA